MLTQNEMNSVPIQPVFYNLVEWINAKLKSEHLSPEELEALPKMIDALAKMIEIV